MKFILRLFLILILSFVGAGFSAVLLQSWYGENMQKALAQKAQHLMETTSGWERITVSFDHLDATLAGMVDTPEQRELARQKVDAMPGARALSANNHVVVPARLTLSRQKDGGFRLSGLAPPATREGLSKWIQGRLDPITVDSSEFRSDPATADLDHFSQDSFGALLTTFLSLTEPQTLDVRMDRVTITGTGRAEVKEALLEQAPRLFVDGSSDRVHVDIGVPPEPPSFMIRRHEADGFELSGLMPADLDREKFLAELALSRPDESMHCDALVTADHIQDPGYIADGRLLVAAKAFLQLKQPLALAFSNGQMALSGRSFATEKEAAVSAAHALFPGSPEKVSDEIQVLPDPTDTLLCLSSLGNGMWKLEGNLVSNSARDFILGRIQAGLPGAIINLDNWTTAEDAFSLPEATLQNLNALLDSFFSLVAPEKLNISREGLQLVGRGMLPNFEETRDHSRKLFPEDATPEITINIEPDATRPSR